MELTSFYKGLLETIGFVVEDDGYVYLDEVTVRTPYQINGKTLVLPTKEILLNPDWKNTIAFHPLSENIARKNSVVLQRLQRLSNIAVNLHTAEIMRTMIEYCADTGSHSKLNHKQTAFLSCFPDADENALKNWDKLMGVLGGDNHFIKIILLRDQKINGEFFSRVCSVKFPVYEACVEMMNNKPKEYTIFGIKVRKKDVHGIRALFEFIFKGIENPDEHYSVGTRSSIAPSFYAVAKSLYNLSSTLQKVYRLLKQDYPDLAWGEQLEDLNKYKGLVPPLEGNEGELTEGERRRSDLNITPPAPTTSKKAPSNKVNVISQTQPVAQLPAPATPQPVPVVQPRPAPVSPQVAQQVVAQASHTAPSTAPVATKREVNVISQVQQQPAQLPPPQGQVVYMQPAPTAYMVDQYGRPIAGVPAQQPMYAQPVQQMVPQYAQPTQMVDRNGRPINAGYHQQPIRVDNQPAYGYAQQGYQGYQAYNPAYNRLGY